MHSDDEARFVDVYSRHHGRVLAFCTRRTSPDLALDAVAETFLVAWRRLDDLPDAELPWLLRTAGLVLRDQARAQRRQDRTAARAASASPAAALDHAGPVAAAADAERALAVLSPADREVLMLSAWDDLSPGQIAVIVGCSPAGARVRLHRARRRLADQLDRPADRPPQPVRLPSREEPA